MKTADEFVIDYNECRGRYYNLEALLHAYGEAVKEECAKIIEETWNANTKGPEAIRNLKLP